METAARVGRWLFINRGWAPIPLLGLELLVGSPIPAGWSIGLPLVAVGEAIRLWGVGHIGPKSRTRGADTWAVVDTGPYGRTRNPLYLGNVVMFVGLGAICGAAWAAAWLTVLGLHYTLIVRWEESNLGASLGQPYLDYLARVPRWLPLGAGRAGGRWAGRSALRSERSTLLAAAVVLLLLLTKGLGVI